MSGVDIAGLVEELRNTRTPGAEFLCLRAADALLAQAAENASLLKERAEAVTEALEATRQRDEALAALKAAREALEPFAAGADFFYRNEPDDKTLSLGRWTEDRRFYADVALTVGHIRRARLVLENGSANLADATNNPPSDPGTEQREAGRG